MRSLLMVAMALLLSACGSSDRIPDGLGTSVPPVGTGGPFVSAHRGGAAYAPENTMLAFHNAARLYVDDFEADAWLTADRVLVLIHDQLDRTTSCSGPVSAKTHAELQSCDAAHWFAPGQPTTVPDETIEHPLRGRGVTIPTAEELFAFAAGFQGPYQPTVTIEIKDGSEALRAAEVLVPLIQASGIQERIIVQSFNPLGIARVKQLDASIRTLYLTPAVLGATAALTVATVGGHEFVAPQFSSRDLDAGFVSRAHALNKQVVPWTADRWSDLETLADIGVDGAITNFPGCMLQMQNRLVGMPLTPPELRHLAVPLCADEPAAN